MKYVIIGASAAGLAAAEQIRKTDPAGAVTLLTRETDLPYSRPSISYYLKGLVRRGQMRLRTPAYYKEQKIEIVTDVEVTAIDRAKKTVKCGRKAYSYDKLCLCTGSVPFVPPMQNVSGKRNVCGFLTAADAQAVHDLASANTRAVVIGAGLIGMKAAEGLSKICKSVDVVELSDRVLPSILDEKSAKLVRRHLEHHGLRICTCGLINAKGDGYTDRVAAADDSYKRLVFRDGKLVGYVLINASENAGIYTSLISGGVPLEGLQGDLMDSPNLFWFPKETRITKLRGGVQL